MSTKVVFCDANLLPRRFGSKTGHYCNSSIRLVFENGVRGVCESLDRVEVNVIMRIMSRCCGNDVESLASLRVMF